MDAPPPPSYAAYPRYYEPRVRFDVIAEAFGLFAARPVAWILGSLPLALILMAYWAYSMGWLPGSAASAPGSMDDFFRLMFESAALALTVNAIQNLLIAGLIQMGVRQIRGEPIGPADAFRFNGRVLAVLVAVILTQLLVGVGTLLCFLPGLILGGLFLITSPLVTDRRMGAIAAIEESLRTLRRDLWVATTIFFVLGLLMFIGVMICGIGIMVAAPIYALSVAGVYADFFVRPGQMAQASAYVPPPVAPRPEQSG